MDWSQALQFQKDKNSNFMIGLHHTVGMVQYVHSPTLTPSPLTSEDCQKKHTQLLMNTITIIIRDPR